MITPAVNCNSTSDPLGFKPKFEIPNDDSRENILTPTNSAIRALQRNKLPNIIKRETTFERWSLESFILINKFTFNVQKRNRPRSFLIGYPLEEL